MHLFRRHPWLGFLVAGALLFAVVVGSYGTYLAGEAGRLPWQEEPTRIAITPFADIPGFTAPTPRTTEATPTP